MFDDRSPEKPREKLVTATPVDEWFSTWNVTGIEPKPHQVIPPRAGVARARLYDGSTADIPVQVVARGGDMLCVEQAVTDRDGQPHTWHAWVSRDRVQPVGRATTKSADRRPGRPTRPAPPPAPSRRGEAAELLRARATTLGEVSRLRP